MENTDQNLISLMRSYTEGLKRDNVCKKTYQDILCLSLIPKLKKIKAVVVKNDIYTTLNPDNYTYTVEEQLVLGVCNKFNIEWEIKEKKHTVKPCLKTIVPLLEKEEIPCETIANISISQTIQNSCPTNPSLISLGFTEDKCKFAYDALIKSESNCNLEFSKYLQYIKLGLTPATIASLNTSSSRFRLSDSGSKLIDKLNPNYTISLKTDLCFNKVNLTGIGSIKNFLDGALIGVPDNIKSEILASYGY